ncbi:HAD-like domain-containing protein [Aspergillus leporis]|uniref:HAD-like domain-containing protein n=1 Tax=Aspergillus leporis TaxID=41062 RepID=A0A5N5WT42_9EURO|nr:HAD-like domain-containing protein [Aspergillus leporis]
MKPTLTIFDFDGTLFDTHASITHTIKQTFTTLLPTQTPPEPEIHRLIASGASLPDTFRALHPNPETFTEETWITTYRTLYATHGQTLIQAFPGAEELLTTLNARKIPVAIVSNKGVEAVKTALERNGLGGLVPENLIIGDKTPGAVRKPDPASFGKVLVPVLRERYGWVGGGEAGDGDGVLVVGDTVADVLFARNIGAKVVWCRFGYGEREVCEGLGPDFVVDSLGGVKGIVDFC